MNAEHTNDQQAAEQGERFTEPSPDRMPTAEEAAAAERAAEGVDLDSVTEHYQEMAERGAHQRGEGAIDGTPGS